MQRKCRKCGAGPFSDPLEITAHHREFHPKNGEPQTEKPEYLEQMFEQRIKLEHELEALEKRISEKLHNLGLVQHRIGQPPE